MKLVHPHPRFIAFNILSFFWLVAKLMSYNLWVNDRLFPIVAVFNDFENLPNSFHLALFYSSIICLILCTFFKPIKIILLILLLTEISSCLLDFTRWQPWEYQYVCMLFIFLTCLDDYKKALQWFGLVLAFIYIYSGIHKIDYHFINNMWLKSILSNLLGITQSTISDFKLTKLGYIFPTIEALAGIGLLFNFWRKKAAIVLIIMHLLLLLIIGPLGLNYNEVVWPWNIAMIAILYVVFLKAETIIVNFNLLLTPKLYVIAFLWVLMPIFNFWNKWPFYLSSNLYSGKAIGMIIQVKSDKIEQHELYKFYDYKDISNNSFTIYIQNWALNELKTPQFPEWFYYKQVAKKLKNKYGNSVKFIIYNSPKKDSLNTIINNQ